ncbi:hypothetical protein ACFE04_015641 [Oxalis oulophora]
MMITAALSKLIRKVFLTKKRLKDPGNLLSPSPSHFLCEICFDWHPLSKSLNPKDCSHFYCFNCIIKYVSSKLDHNITNIRCPESGCKGLLDDPDDYRSVLPKKLFHRWGMALCESAIEIPKKFYCPYVNCSVLLINDGKCKIQKFMCPNCKRLFCVECKAPWHTEFSCAKYQVIAKKGNDTLMEELSKKKGWMKCPKCSVENISATCVDQVPATMTNATVQEQFAESIMIDFDV